MMNPLFIRNLGTWEILLILLVVLIIFGVGRLPEVGAGLGKGIRNFKKGIRGDEEDKEDPKDTGQNSSSTPKA